MRQAVMAVLATLLCPVLARAGTSITPPAAPAVAAAARAIAPAWAGALHKAFGGEGVPINPRTTWLPVLTTIDFKDPAQAGRTWFLVEWLKAQGFTPEGLTPEAVARSAEGISALVAGLAEKPMGAAADPRSGPEDLAQALKAMDSIRTELGLYMSSELLSRIESAQKQVRERYEGMTAEKVMDKAATQAQELQGRASAPEEEEPAPVAPEGFRLAAMGPAQEKARRDLALVQQLSVVVAVELEKGGRKGRDRIREAAALIASKALESGSESVQIAAAKNLLAAQAASRDPEAAALIVESLGALAAGTTLHNVELLVWAGLLRQFDVAAERQYAVDVLHQFRRKAMTSRAMLEGGGVVLLLEAALKERPEPQTPLQRSADQALKALLSDAKDRVEAHGNLGEPASPGPKASLLREARVRARAGAVWDEVDEIEKGLRALRRVGQVVAYAAAALLALVFVVTDKAGDWPIILSALSLLVGFWLRFVLPGGSPDQADDLES